MSGSTWKTGAPVTRAKPIARPTGAQLGRQLLMLGLIGVVWAIGLAVVLSATGTGAENIIVNLPDTPTPAVKPTRVPATAIAAAPPTSTPTALAPTIAPSPTSAPTTSASTVTASTQPPTVAATSRATVTKSATPTKAPTTAPTAAADPSPTVVATAASGGGGSGGAVSFSQGVKPILDRVCVKCHGGEQTNASLVLKSYDQIIAGSENGPVIAPGDPANSLLVDLITKGKMPKKGPHLLPSEIRTISDWIKAGALNN